MERLPSQPALPPVISGSGEFSFFRLQADQYPQAPARRTGPSARLREPKVDENGNFLRRRKRHVKSRGGCIHCKGRRVKVSLSSIVEYLTLLEMDLMSLPISRILFSLAALKV